MFGMFGGDLAKVFDFDKINLQKKTRVCPAGFYENARTFATT